MLGHVECDLVPAGLSGLESVCWDDVLQPALDAQEVVVTDLAPIVESESHQRNLAARSRL